MRILDATAGKRMMWFDKNHKDTVYLDKRKDRHPSIVADFTRLPFRDECFDLVVFDPPHLSLPSGSILYEKFGSLRASKIVPVLYRASRELFRVLKKDCVLIFKWNTHNRELGRVLTCFPIKPLFGQRSAFRTKHASSTYWVTFVKHASVEE